MCSPPTPSPGRGWGWEGGSLLRDRKWLRFTLQHWLTFTLQNAASFLVKARSFCVSSRTSPLVFNDNKCCQGASLLPKQSLAFLGRYVIR